MGRPDSNFRAGGVGHSLEEVCEAEASYFWLVDAPKPSRVLGHCCGVTILRNVPVAIDILSQEGDLLDALFHQVPDLFFDGLH